jgi:hypothetical protein
VINYFQAPRWRAIAKQGAVIGLCAVIVVTAAFVAYQSLGVIERAIDRAGERIYRSIARDLRPSHAVPFDKRRIDPI